MISVDFFKREMNKLEQQFGGNKFSTIKQDLIFNQVRNWSEIDLVTKVNNFIGNFDRPPKLEDFFISNSSSENYDCVSCSGAGLLTKDYIKGVGSFAYRCVCKNGEKFKKNFKTLDEIRRELTI